MTSFGDLNFLWHLESNLQILLVFFLAHEFVWPAVAIISVFLLLLDIQTLLLMCNLDSSLTDLMNETLGLGLQNRLPRFLGMIFLEDPSLIRKIYICRAQFNYFIYCIYYKIFFSSEKVSRPQCRSCRGEMQGFKQC